MEVIENNSRLENTEKDTPTAPFEKSGLRLVTDLQHCIKAQQSKAYAGKVKLSNLQTMAKTLSYVQEHGYNTVEDAEGKLAEIKELASSSRKELKDIEGRLRQVNEQIHYTGQYLANKSIYSQFLRSKNKGQFRQEHSSELAIYETAVKFLKEKAGDGQLPTLQTLKAEKEKLLVQKKEAKEKYYYYRDYQKELDTVCGNIHAALGQQQSGPVRKQERDDIS